MFAKRITLKYTKFTNRLECRNQPYSNLELSRFFTLLIKHLTFLSLDYILDTNSSLSIRKFQGTRKCENMRPLTVNCISSLKYEDADVNFSTYVCYLLVYVGHVFMC